MTPQEWLTSTNSEAMWSFVQNASNVFRTRWVGWMETKRFFVSPRKTELVTLLLHQPLPARLKADLLRDILGNIFAPEYLDPRWLLGCDGAVSKIAWEISESGAFSELPVLADALEECGCANEVILAHCRNQEIHTQGCWVVDLLVSRKW
jgi:hypothetical protein